MTLSVSHFALVIAAMTCVACDQGPPRTDIRLSTDSFAIRVSAEIVPPRARERTRFKVVVSHRESGQPIEGGEGRIFASNADATNPDRADTWDALLPGEELGTYYGTLNFVTSGPWAMAIQFRRDSTRVLERIDWTQDVSAERAAFPSDS